MRPQDALRCAGGVVALAVLSSVLAPAAGAEHQFGKPGDDAVAEEMKAIVPVMRAAVKSDHRRQAWYAAQRVLAVDAKNSEALGVAGQWKPEELVEGVDPEKGFMARRDAAYAKAGAAYAALSRVLTAQGMKPTDYWFVVERAMAYGNRDADVVAAVDQSNLAWAGTWGAVPKKGKWEEWIAPLGGAVTWPEEWDDRFLKAKAFWPEAKVSRLWGWRVIASLPPDEMWRVLGTLAAMESHLVETLGSIRKAPRDAKREEEELTDLLLLPDPALYEKIGLVDLKNAVPEVRTRFKDATGWHNQGRRRLLALVKHPVDAWIGDDANWLGYAAPVVARAHLGPPSGTLSGRGTWILDGIRGAYEGFVPKGTTGGEIDIARCWRLPAARAIRDMGYAVPWEKLMEFDRTHADEHSRTRVKIRFGGAMREVTGVDIVAAQATALVLAILRSDSKGPKRLADLLKETMKRDRMPDLDKVLGWPKGKAFDEANKLIEAVDTK
jgi:hypothetical protein